MYPSSTVLIANEVLSLLGTIEILPMESALTVFAWSQQRITPVRITDIEITEEAFDPQLNPIRAKVSLGMRVLNVNDVGFLTPAGALYLTYQLGQGSAWPRAGLRKGEHSDGPAGTRGADHLGRRNRRPRPTRTAATTARGPSSSRWPDGTPVRVPGPADHPAGRHLHRHARRTSSSTATASTTCASQFLGDPLLYWMICDANGATDPDELTAQAGRTILIPVAVGDLARSAQWLARCTSRCWPARSRPSRCPSR